MYLLKRLELLIIISFKDFKIIAFRKKQKKSSDQEIDIIPL